MRIKKSEIRTRNLEKENQKQKNQKQNQIQKHIKFRITGSNQKSGTRTNQTLVTGLESDQRVSNSVQNKKDGRKSRTYGISIDYIPQGLQFLAIFP